MRRLALFIEESIYRGSQWAVFEPNDEHLWTRVRSTVSNFMTKLLREGTFPAPMPDEDDFVKSNRKTLTQNDIDQGIINIQVGFASAKPAEFAVINIHQIAL